MKRARIERKAEVTNVACGCCGSQAILTLTASTPGTPVTLCAECIIAFAQALARQR